MKPTIVSFIYFNDSVNVLKARTCSKALLKISQTDTSRGLNISFIALEEKKCGEIIVYKQY